MGTGLALNISGDIVKKNGRELLIQSKSAKFNPDKLRGVGSASNSGINLLMCEMFSYITLQG